MIRVSPIRLQVGTKVLWFDPKDLEVRRGDNVIVSTERGTEYGTATADVMEVSDELVSSLRSPLKPVIRIATPEDEEVAAELAAKGEEALPVFRELAAEASDEMRPVAVDFLFSGDKAVFYFEAEQRVDFRDLVRRLASRFHVRVDMRQIGVRDGARIIGGLGHCGQELCCKRLGGEFSPVSIRMAKEQNLSLNPQKISGCCGRLMCCLRYEYDAYKEVNSHAPKHGAKIEVPGGVARVTEVNVPLETVTLQLEDGKSIKVPIAEMEVEEGARRPTKVSQEVFDKYSAPDPLEMFTANFEVASFTGQDKLADPNARPNIREHHEGDGHRKPRRRRRGGSGKGSADKGASAEAKAKDSASKGASPKDGSSKEGAHSDGHGQPKGDGHRKPRRRGGRGHGGQKSRERSVNAAAESKGGNSGNGAKQRRPGQKSSGVRNAPAKQQGGSGQGSAPKGEVAHRKPRRRRRTSGGNGNAASSE